ncbi:hypothetical protein A2U01_0112810, partial [Trifolium medium]|nr:hypothetical protein [Trifolium medium]
MLATNQASFENFEAQGGNFVGNAYDVEKQMVEIGIKQQAIVEQEELEEKDNGMREPLKV